jgi:hypothetical protein
MSPVQKMSQFEVGDRVKWTRDTSEVVEGDLGTIIIAYPLKDTYLVKLDIKRVSRSRVLARPSELVRADGEVVCRECHIAKGRHHQKCRAMTIECPCGIRRAQCDYHRDF